MHTYRELFRVPEFRPLFLTVSVQVAAGTVNGLALGTLVYSATGSPLLSALSLFGGAFAQVIGAATLLSAADRVPPRAALVALALLFGLGTLVLTIPGMPVWCMFLVIGVLGLADSVGGGVRWGLLGEILPDDGYILGRCVQHVSRGHADRRLRPRWRAGRRHHTAPRAAHRRRAVLHRRARRPVRPEPARAEGRRSTVGPPDLAGERPTLVGAGRPGHLAMRVPNGLVVGCEALFIPYAPGGAGVLFMAGALGMLAGDTVMGRFLPPRWRARLITPLQVLLAVPYLLFALPLALPVAAIAVAVASAGFGAGLLLQNRLIALTPDDLRGQALGLHSAGMLTMQAVAATVAGVVAQQVPVAAAMVTMAVLSLLVTLVLMPRLRQPLDVGPGVRVGQKVAA